MQGFNLNNKNDMGQISRQEPALGNPEPIIVTHSRPIDQESDDDSRFWEPRLTTMREEAKREISAIPDICYDLIARTVVAGFRVSTNVDRF